MKPGAVDLVARDELIEWIARRAAATASGVAVSSFVLSPGNPGPLKPNVFATEAALKAALNLTQGVRVVALDPTFAPIVLAGGTWSATDDIDVEGLPTNVSVTVTVTGPLSGVRSWSRVALTYTGAAPLFTAAANQINPFFTLTNCFVVSSPVPLFDASAAGSFMTIQLAGATFVSNGAQLARTSGVSFGIELDVGEGSSLGDDCLFGPAGSFFGLQEPGGSISPTQAGITAGPIGWTFDPIAPASQTTTFSINAGPVTQEFGVPQTSFLNTGAGLAACCLGMNTSSHAYDYEKTIVFADDATITAGTYTFIGPTTLVGEDPRVLTLNDGVYFNAFVGADGVSFTSASTTQVVTSLGFPDPTTPMVFRKSSIAQTGAGCFLGLSPGNDVPNVFLKDTSAWTTTSGPVLQVRAGAGGAQTLELWIDSTSSVDTNCLQVNAGCTLVVHVAPGGSCSSTQLGAGTLQIIYEATPSVTVATQAAQGAALTGDLFNPGGPGVAFVPRTTTAIVQFTSTGNADLATRQMQFAVTASTGVVNGSAVTRASPGGDAGFTVSAAGLVYLTGLTPGTPCTVRVQWGISGGAGTYASTANGTLVISEPK